MSGALSRLPDSWFPSLPHRHCGIHMDELVGVERTYLWRLSFELVDAHMVSHLGTGQAAALPLTDARSQWIKVRVSGRR